MRLKRSEGTFVTLCRFCSRWSRCVSGGKVTTQKARAGSTGRRESTGVKGEQVGGEMCKGSGGGALSYIKFVRFWFLQPHGLTTACVAHQRHT